MNGQERHRARKVPRAYSKPWECSTLNDRRPTQVDLPCISIGLAVACTWRLPFLYWKIKKVRLHISLSFPCGCVCWLRGEARCLLALSCNSSRGFIRNAISLTRKTPNYCSNGGQVLSTHQEHVGLTKLSADSISRLRWLPIKQLWRLLVNCARLRKTICPAF